MIKSLSTVTSILDKLKKKFFFSQVKNLILISKNGHGLKTLLSVYFFSVAADSTEIICVKHEHEVP